MTERVNPFHIERLVGTKRHAFKHFARANSEEQCVYILHPQGCLDTIDDVRNCRYSLALDSNGIDPEEWEEDAPLEVTVNGAGDEARLIPRVVQNPTFVLKPDPLCSRQGCARPLDEHEHGVFCP